MVRWDDTLRDTRQSTAPPLSGLRAGVNEAPHPARVVRVRGEEDESEGEEDEEED